MGVVSSEAVVVRAARMRCAFVSSVTLMRVQICITLCT
jgi:hypothetical protein